MQRRSLNFHFKPLKGGREMSAVLKFPAKKDYVIADLKLAAWGRTRKSPLPRPKCLV